MNLWHMVWKSVGSDVSAMSLAAAGAIITAVFQLFRDGLSRADAKRLAIRELISRLDELYRASKQIKRQLRARNQDAVAMCLPDAESPDINRKGRGRRGKPQTYLISIAYFQERLDELSRLQLTVEEIRQIVRARVDLFPLRRIKRLQDLLSYSDDYLHELIDEYETARLPRVDHAYRIDDATPYLADFLRLSWSTVEAERLFTLLNAGMDRATAFGIVEKIRAEADRDFGAAKDKPRRRTKCVSDLCLRAALAEMREELVWASRPIWKPWRPSPAPANESAARNQLESC